MDAALLATGPLLLPLAVWGARHRGQVKKRKKLIQEAVWDFNERMAGEGRNGRGEVRMVWNTHVRGGAGESYLTIEEVLDGEGVAAMGAGGGGGLTSFGGNNYNEDDGDEFAGFFVGDDKEKLS